MSIKMIQQSIKKEIEESITTKQLLIGNGLNERVEIDEQLDKVRDASSDRYEMIKSIYYQNRNAQLEEEYIQNLPVPKIYIE